MPGEDRAWVGLLLSWGSSRELSWLGIEGETFSWRRVSSWRVVNRDVVLRARSNVASRTSRYSFPAWRSGVGSLATRGWPADSVTADPDQHLRARGGLGLLRRNLSDTGPLVGQSVLGNAVAAEVHREVRQSRFGAPARG